MLKKLLKYDLRSMFKYWWIVSIISLALSCVGAISMRLLISEREFPTIIELFSALSLIFSFLGTAVFTVFAVVMIYVRFFKNFFTDEGYLTFTLPVKRTQLLNSKIISGLIVYIATYFVFILDFVIIFVAGLYDHIFKDEFIDVLKLFFSEIWDDLGAFTIIYTLEIIALSILLLITSIIFTFICITLASIITKKAKGLVAVVLYYAISSAVTTVIQVLSFLALPFLSLLANVPEAQIKPVLLLVLITLILLAASICGILYSIVYRMLDKKLNLA